MHIIGTYPSQVPHPHLPCRLPPVQGVHLIRDLRALQHGRSSFVHDGRDGCGAAAMARSSDVKRGLYIFFIYNYCLCLSNYLLMCLFFCMANKRFAFFPSGERIAVPASRLSACRSSKLFVPTNRCLG